MAIPETIQTLEAELQAIPPDTEAAEKAKLEKEIYYKMAKAWDEAKDLEQALSCLEQAQEKLTSYEASPEEAALVYYNLGGVQYDLKQIEAAKATYEQMLELPPNQHQADAYYRLAICLYHLGAPKAATDTLEQGLTLENSSTEQVGKLHQLAVIIYAERKDNTEALRHIEAALEALATAPKALGETFHNMRAFIKSAMSPSNQKVYYERLLEQYEGQPIYEAFIQHNLGLWYQQAQKIKEAQAAYEAALSLKIKENITYELGDTYYWLAGIYQDQNRREEASNYYLKALEAMQAEQELQYATMVVYALEHIAEALPAEDAQKAEIEQALEQAKANGISIEALHYHEEEEESPDFSEEDISFQALVSRDPEEVFREAQAQAKNDPEAYIRAANTLLEHLEQRYQKAWLGKKKKRQAYEAQKAEIIAEAQALTQDVSLNEEQEAQLNTFVEALQKTARD